MRIMSRLARPMVILLCAFLFIGCNKPPIAVIKTDSVIGALPLTVALDGRSSYDPDGSVSSYTWTFPGGQTYAGAFVSHTFSDAGEYPVTLKVVDNQGGEDTENVTVLSLAPASPVFERLSGESGGQPVATHVYSAVGTGVYRANLKDTHLKNSRLILLKDNGSHEGADGSLTGFDLDAIVLSTREVERARDVDNLGYIDAFDYSGSETQFTPGAQTPPVDEKLFGTDSSGSKVDNAAATLGSFDGYSSTSRPNGFLSMGLLGTLKFTLKQSVSTDNLYLYVGEVGNNSPLLTGDVVVYGIPAEGYVAPQATMPPDLSQLLLNAREALERGDTEIDLDGDGRKEYSRVFNAEGKVISEQVDLDGDGSGEMFWTYAADSAIFKADINKDGIDEITNRIVPDTTVPGKFTVEVAEDTSGDGIPDYRTRYTIDPAVDKVRIVYEQDDDQDGTFTNIGESETDRIANSWSYEFHEGTQDVCNPEQREKIAQAFRTVFSQGWSCLTKMDMRLGYEYMLLLGKSTFYVKCTSLPKGCAAMDTLWWPLPWNTNVEPPLWIDSAKGFNGACGSLEEVIFHELLHYLLGPHPFTIGVTNPSDRVTNCAETCFGAGNSQTCAACLGKKNGYPACSQYPNKPCSGNVPTYCRCDGQVYSSPTRCAALCSVSMSCFAFQCRELGPCR